MIDTDRVKQLLRERGWKQADLARQVRVSQSAISQVMKGKTRDTRLLPAIASALNASVAYLKGESDNVFEEVEGTITPRDLAERLKLRLVGTAIRTEETQAAVAEGMLLQPLDPTWLFLAISKFDPSVLEVEDEDFIPPVTVAVVATDGMSPTMERGDQVMVSLWTNKVNVSDGIWLFEYGGLRMIRRLMPLPDGNGYRAYADNPASPTFEAPLKDIRVLGRAFWIGRGIA